MNNKTLIGGAAIALFFLVSNNETTTKKSSNKLVIDIDDVDAKTPDYSVDDGDEANIVGTHWTNKL